MYPAVCSIMLNHGGDDIGVDDVIHIG